MADKPSLMQKEIDDKRRIIGGTKMEQERFRKKNVGETEDRLDAIGSENEKKGIKATKEAFKEHNREALSIKSDRIAWLNVKAKFASGKIDYYRHVNTVVQYELSWLELPIGYTVKSQVTDQGIRLILKDRWGQLHAGAFTPCSLGVYDEQACRSSVNKLDDAITYLEKNPPSGVYLS